MPTASRTPKLLSMASKGLRDPAPASPAADLYGSGTLRSCHSQTWPVPHHGSAACTVNCQRIPTPPPPCGLSHTTPNAQNPCASTAPGCTAVTPPATLGYNCAGCGHRLEGICFSSHPSWEPREGQGCTLHLQTLASVPERGKSVQYKVGRNYVCTSFLQDGNRGSEAPRGEPLSEPRLRLTEPHAWAHWGPRERAQEA